MYSRPLFGGNMQGAGVWEDMNAWGKQNGANFHKTLNEFAIHNNKMLFGGSDTSTTILDQQIDDLKNYRRIINSRKKYGNAAERDIINQDVLIISDLIRKLEQKKRGSNYQLEHQIASLTDFLRSRGYHIVTVVETRGAFHLLPLPADIVDEPPPVQVAVANPGVAQVTNPRYTRGGALNFRNLYQAPRIRRNSAADRARRAASAARMQGTPYLGTPIDLPESNIPNFELLTTDTTTTPRGTPSGIPIHVPTGVPYNAIRASSVVENNSDFTPRGTPTRQPRSITPYSRTITTLQNELNIARRDLAEFEQMRDQFMSLRQRSIEAIQQMQNNGQGHLRDVIESYTETINRMNQRLPAVERDIILLTHSVELLTRQLAAGNGNDIIYTNTSLEFPPDYTPPGGFVDDPLLGAGMYIQTEDPMAKYA
jgi:cell fate (sporulation/competence/biofilm development) regulator YlbF (YheA/YmcA/DUF963 family)